MDINIIFYFWKYLYTICMLKGNGFYFKYIDKNIYRTSLKHILRVILYQGKIDTFQNIYFKSSYILQIEIQTHPNKCSKIWDNLFCFLGLCYAGGHTNALSLLKSLLSIPSLMILLNYNKDIDLWEIFQIIGFLWHNIEKCVQQLHF